MGFFKGCLWGFVSVVKWFSVPLPIQNIYTTTDYGREGFMNGRFRKSLIIVFRVFFITHKTVLENEYWHII